MKTKEQALEEGMKVFNQVPNNGNWKFELHENLGWHWNIFFPQSDGEYLFIKQMKVNFSAGHLLIYLWQMKVYGTTVVRLKLSKKLLNISLVSFNQ